MEIILALSSAALVGTADFFGGMASRRGRVVAVALWVHLVGIAVLALVVSLSGGTPQTSDHLLGALAGAAAGLGVLSLYRGFAVSRIGVVSPVSAVTTASIPVLFGVITGERPSGLEWTGLAVGVIAIALVSRASDQKQQGTAGSGVVYGLGAGLGFAILFIALSHTSAESGIWPLLPARLTGAVAVGALGWLRGRQLLPLASAWKPILAAGLLSIVGNFAFIVATREGMLSIVAVLTALYPAATVLLARVVLKELLNRAQLAGLAMALVAVALIAV